MLMENNWKTLTEILYLTIEDFIRVYKALSKHEGAGRIRDSYAHPRMRLGFA